MHTPEIRCYSASQPTQEHYLFVLNKGYNSGRPLKQPCPNCFVIKCSTADEHQFYYGLCLGLWKAKRFEIYLTGSVIEFLQINDFKRLIRDHSHRVNCEIFRKTTKAVALLEEQEAAIRRQLQLLQELKISILRKCF